MKLPRGLSGSEVARLLARHYGYRATSASVPSTLLSARSRVFSVYPSEPSAKRSSVDPAEPAP